MGRDGAAPALQLPGGPRVLPLPLPRQPRVRLPEGDRTADVAGLRHRSVRGPAARGEDRVRRAAGQRQYQHHPDRRRGRRTDRAGSRHDVRPGDPRHRRHAGPDPPGRSLARAPLHHAAPAARLRPQDPVQRAHRPRGRIRLPGRGHGLRHRFQPGDLDPPGGGGQRRLPAPLLHDRALRGGDGVSAARGPAGAGRPQQAGRRRIPLGSDRRHEDLHHRPHRRLAGQDARDARILRGAPRERLRGRRHHRHGRRCLRRRRAHQ